MEQKEVCIYEVLPLLREVLNISGFCKMLGKSISWLNNKESKEQAFERIPIGFTEDNVELINYGLEKVVDACQKHKLHLPSSCSNREVYNKYVKTELKELRKLISIVYLRENYTKIPKSSFDKKLINAANRGTVAQFTEDDIQQINNGIDKVSELLYSIKVIL